MDLEIVTAFIQYNFDMNQDHAEGSRLSYTAFRHCRNIFTYQTNGYISDRDFYPRFFEDISDMFDTKKELLIVMKAIIIAMVDYLRCVVCEMKFGDIQIRKETQQ